MEPVPQSEPVAAPATAPVAVKAVWPSAYSLLKQALAMFRANFGTFVKLAIPTFTCSLAITALTSLLSVQKGAVGSVVLGLVMFVLVIFSMVLSIASAIALIKSIDAKSKGESLPVRVAYKLGFKFFFPYLWMLILFMLAFYGGLFLLIIPGIVLGFYLSLTYYFSVVGDYRGLKALCASFYYVRKNGWEIFCKNMFFVLIALILGILFAGIIFLVVYLLGGNTTSLLKDEAMKLLPYYNVIEAIFSLLINLLVSLVFTPIVVAYFYFVYKHILTTKPVPIPEVDFKTSRPWFMGLSIFGFVALVLLTIGMFVAVVLGGLNSARMKAELANQQQVSLFPATAQELTVMNGSALGTVFTPADGSFSIRFPKGLEVDEDMDGAITAAGVDSVVYVYQTPLTPVALRIPPADIAKELLDQMMGSLDPSVEFMNPQYSTYEMNGKKIYAVQGSYVSLQNENPVLLFFIQDKLKEYIIEVSYAKEDEANIWSYLDSVATFKTIN